MIGTSMQITGETVRAATIMVSIGPIIIMYPFLQKYFVKGILVGSLKG
jgi:putative aldouronate transport system permease protein